MEVGIRSSLGLDSKEWHDSLIYPAMIQTGVQRFRIVGDKPKEVRDSEFLRRRCEEHSYEEDYNQLFDSIKAVMASHTLQSAKSDSEGPELFMLTWFLTELVFSLRTKSAMISISRIPEASRYAGKLTPEMLAAVGNLMQKVNSVNLNLPIPQSEVLSDDVTMLHELISSDLFALYASSHQMLESSEEKEQSAVENILSKAKALRDRFNRALDVERLSLSLIPVTVSLIDNVCGKFPGSLADVFGNALTEALKSRRRITIYNYGDVHLKLLLKHYKGVSAANLNEPQQADPDDA
jgi:hypothetical protein